MVGRGGVTDFDGDLDDYQRYLLEEAKRLREEAKEAVRKAAEPAPKPAAAAPKPAAEAPAAGRDVRKQDAQSRQLRTDQAKPLKRELGQIDERLAAAGRDKSTIEARLAKSLPAAEIAEAGKRLKALNEEIETLEERWLALSGQLETLAA